MSLALILALMVSGFLHGLNPISGWPIALARGTADWRSCLAAMVPVACGHLVGMGLLLLPMAALISMLRWQNEIQLGAIALLIALGAILALRLRKGHTTRLSFGQMTGLSCFAALAQGNAVMLIALMLFGLCGAEQGIIGDTAVNSSVAGNMVIVLSAMLLHLAAMAMAGTVAIFAMTRLGLFRLAVR